MISLKKRNQGFTIVELLIVIVVIGILAALVITTYAGIQSKARNAKRQTDIQSVQTQVEAFYSQNGYYPSYADLNGAAWRTTNMKSLDAQALIDPSAAQQSPAQNTSPLINTAPTATSKAYGYQPTDSSGNSCETTDTSCAQYTLTAAYEGTVNGATTYVKKNLD